MEVRYLRRSVLVAETKDILRPSLKLGLLFRIENPLLSPSPRLFTPPVRNDTTDVLGYTGPLVSPVSDRPSASSVSPLPGLLVQILVFRY